MLLLIDNYDSFTYNLFQYLSELRQEVWVMRNDQTSLAEIEAKSPERIVISPGPGTPAQAGISNDVIRHFGEKVPILGVCLGHQCIGYTFGGRVDRASEIKHGKSSLIQHDGKGLFRRAAQPLLCYPLSFTGGYGGKPARMSGGERAVGERTDYGATPPPVSGGRRAVPPGVDYD